MQLTLVVPGLLWPRQLMRDILYDADFPALQTLLGMGGLSSTVATSVESWWATYFDIYADQFAAAPLRLAALGETPGTARWLCADPVNLRIEQRGAALTDPALLNISAAEARQLHAALAPLFDDLGELIVTTPSHWHLRLQAPAPSLPAYLSDFIEHSAVALLPAGDAGREWRRRINQAQMLLHAHPLNAQREAQGKAVINSLALWGEGCAPVLRNRAGVTLLSDDLMLCGAGTLAGMSVHDLPNRFDHDRSGDCIAFCDALRFPTARHDGLAWRESLQSLEADWLAPALAALKKGLLKRIDLHGFGEGQCLSATLTKLDLYRFWRQTRRLETCLENP